MCTVGHDIWTARVLLIYFNMVGDIFSIVSCGSLVRFRASQSSLIPVRDFIVLIDEGELVLTGVSDMQSTLIFGMHVEITLFMVIPF